VRQEIRTTLADHLAALSPRDRAIVQRRFGLDGTGAAKTLEQVGREMGISRERVRQIELRALRQLRTTLGDSGAELLAG
jgi:RNA polymerase nonessential primary-like sigma factor